MFFVCCCTLTLLPRNYSVLRLEWKVEWTLLISKPSYGRRQRVRLDWVHYFSRVRVQMSPSPTRNRTRFQVRVRVLVNLLKSTEKQQEESKVYFKSIYLSNFIQKDFPEAVRETGYWRAASDSHRFYKLPLKPRSSVKPEPTSQNNARSCVNLCKSKQHLA